jgi:hypothetical protein
MRFRQISQLLLNTIFRNSLRQFMSTTESDSGGLYAQLPWSVKLGLALLGLVYGVAILTDSIKDPIPDDVWGIIWFAVAAGLLVRAVRLHKQSS